VAQPLAEYARRVADLLQLFTAKGLVQRDGDTAVVRTIAVPPDELAKEWNELVSLVQEMVRRRKCAQKDRALSSNKYPAYRVELPCLNALLLEAEAAKEAVWDVDKTCEQLRSWYKGLPSFEEKVEVVCAFLRADKSHGMLFIGPPGSGKIHCPSRCTRPYSRLSSLAGCRLLQPASRTCSCRPR